MPDDINAEQLARLHQAFGVGDAHTLAVRMGVQFAQLSRWQGGTPIPWNVFERAAERTGRPASWLACRDGADPAH